MWAMVKAANEADSERLKNITTRLIANLMCDYKLVHLVVDNLGVKVRHICLACCTRCGGSRCCSGALEPSPPPPPASFLLLPFPPAPTCSCTQSLIAISKTSNSPTTKLWCATAIRQLSWHPKLLPRLVSEGVIPGTWGRPARHYLRMLSCTY
jgi:hypothetical protein